LSEFENEVNSGKLLASNIFLKTGGGDRAGEEGKNNAAYKAQFCG
jgi:hypothetical protein